MKKINKISQIPDSKKKIKYNNSALELRNNNQNLNFPKIEIKKDIIKSKEDINNEENNIYKNASIENQNVSKEIFNNLDKIQKTLLEDVKNMIPVKDENQNKENKDNKYAYNHIIKYFDKNNNKYHPVPIKSRTSVNFFKIDKSNNTVSDYSKNLNTFQTHKRLKSTQDKKPQHITRYLERKTINDIPVTYPLYLSYNNRYNSISEKNRVDKILSKLICLKTHLMKDPLNKEEIIKEFLLRNGFDKDIYYTKEGINNFYNYLKQPLSFPPEHNLSDVVNDAIKFTYDEEKDNENMELHLENFLNYTPKNRKWDSVGYSSKRKTKNKSYENKVIYNILMEEIYKKRYENNDSYKNKTLPILIKDLEHELRQIKNDKMEKLEKYNELLNNKEIHTIKLCDTNKYVPNLCLVSKGFKEKYMLVIDKKNKKIIKNINKQEHLKKINNRMYYDKLRKNNMVEFDRNDIQRKLKLTEYIVMERAKKKLLYQKVKNAFKSSLENLNKKE